MTTQITLPRDAEGREIPLDTETVYSREGNKLCISRIEFSPLCKEWTLRIVGIDGKIFRTWVLYPWQAYIEKPAPPDSWEKLLDDMERAIHTPDPGTYDSLMCGYFDSINTDCDECERKHRICRETCNDAAWMDITARIHKLMAGEDK